MGIKQLGYLGLEVSNLEAWESYAGPLLGFDVSKDDATGRLYLRMDAYHHRIALHEGPSDDLAYIGWQVNTEPELEDLAQKLEANGTKVTALSPEELDIRKVYKAYRFQDPSGIVSEIFYGRLAMYTEKIHHGFPVTGFNADELGLGHCGLVAKNLEETIKFYRDVLGMRISDHVLLPVGDTSIPAAFFHCNPRHHSVAFLEMELPKKLQHFMIELLSLDDVGRGYDRCQEAGVPLATTIGKHTNDHMHSFYMQSPSGFSVEYGWGARLIDDETWVAEMHTHGSIWGHKLVDDRLFDVEDNKQAAE